LFKTIKNALKTPDVRKRILYTLLLLVIFRLGCYITVPGVDAVALQNATLSTGIGAYINLISGGAFSRFSVFAMSISPYITASIVVQLLAMIIPSLERLTKEGGEQGRRVINKYTKIATIILALVQAVAVYFTYSGTGIFVKPGLLTGTLVTTSLVAGTAFLIWLAEQIDSRGIGNGISVLIFAGIISGLPSAVVTIWSLIITSAGFSTTGLITSIGIILGAIVLVAGVVFVQEAERRVPVQYSKRVVGRKMVGAQNTHIPLKLVMAGVMPVIFASSFMTFPAMIISMFVKNPETLTGFLGVLYKFSMATSTSQVGIGYSIANAIVYLLLILGFTFFYTYATFNPAEVSNNIKKNGGFVPGIRAGKPTTDYLSSIITKLTLFGGMFLALIAILPMLLTFTGLNVSFGGTSILIVVGVALETVRQLESQLMMRHYKGFLE
jgi:preprotein translocase subunit SecY